MSSNRKNKSPTRSPGKISTPSHFETHELVSLLQQFRQELSTKLESYDLIHASQSPPTCLKHDSFVSLYNETNKTLECAICFSKSNKRNLKQKPNIVPI